MTDEYGTAIIGATLLLGACERGDRVSGQCHSEHLWECGMIPFDPRLANAFWL